MSEMDAFFYPDSVAVVGASPTPGRVGYVMVENLLNSPGVRVFPVNPRGGEMLGLKIYPSLKDIPQRVDLAMIAISANAIPEVIEDCAHAGIRAAIIHSPGFAEIGEEGKKLQQRVVDIARRGGVRLVGPNTQGLINLDIGLPALTVPFFHYLAPRGPTSFIAHSGLFPWEFLLRHPHIGLNKMIDLGNASDVEHAEVLNYFGNDPGTKAIALHIEGLGEGRKLMEVASRLARKKPVVALKSGCTPGGTKAAASHSGRLAGRDEVFEAAFKQTGIFRVKDMDDLCDYLLALSCLPPVRGKRIGILTTSGAAGILAADACYEFGLELASLSEDTIRKVREKQPDWVNLSNPMDIWQVLEEPLTSFATALDAVAREPAVDALALMTHVLPYTPFDTLDILREFVRQGIPKPTAVWALGSDERLKELDKLSSQGLVHFPTIARAVRALAISYTFHQRT